VGTQCKVTETGNGGALTTTYAVDGGSSSSSAPTVVIGSTQKVVTVTNTFVQTGGNITVTLRVTKVLSGNTTVPNGTKFVVHVVCTGGASVDQNLTFTYPDLGPLSITTQIDSLDQLSCTVTETDTGGVQLLGYRVDGGALNNAPPTVVLDIDNPTHSVIVDNDPHTEVLGASATRGTLPFTGSSLPQTLTFLAAALLGIGTVALAVSERRRRGLSS
jgi:hypothetical protein